MIEGEHNGRDEDEKVDAHSGSGTLIAVGRHQHSEEIEREGHRSCAARCKDEDDIVHGQRAADGNPEIDGE